MSKQFYFKQFILASAHCLNTLLFDPEIEPYQVLTFNGAMAMKRYSASPQNPAILKAHHQIA